MLTLKRKRLSNESVNSNLCKCRHKDCSRVFLTTKTRWQHEQSQLHDETKCGISCEGCEKLLKRKKGIDIKKEKEKINEEIEIKKKQEYDQRVIKMLTSLQEQVKKGEDIHLNRNWREDLRLSDSSYWNNYFLIQEPSENNSGGIIHFPVLQKELFAWYSTILNSTIPEQESVTNHNQLKGNIPKFLELFLINFLIRIVRKGKCLYSRFKMVFSSYKF